MPLNDQDISMIMSAIAETPQFQFLDQMMTAHNAGEAEATSDELDPEGEEGLQEPGLDEDPGLDEGFPPEDDLDELEMGDEELPDDDLAPGDDVDTDELTPEDEDADQHGLANLAVKGGKAAGRLGRGAASKAQAAGQVGRNVGAAGAKGARRANRAAKNAVHAGFDKATDPMMSAAKGLGNMSNTQKGLGLAGAGYAGGHIDARVMQKRKANRENKQMARRNRQPDRYSKLLASHNSLVQDHGRLASRMDTMVREKADTERYSALQQLAHQYPDFVDVESEAQATLYSQGASLSNQAFEQHLANIERYAQRAEAVARENRPDIPRGQAERLQPQGHADQYAAKLADETVRVYTHAINRGDTMTYEEAKEKAREKLGQ